MYFEVMILDETMKDNALHHVTPKGCFSSLCDKKPMWKMAARLPCGGHEAFGRVREFGILRRTKMGQVRWAKHGGSWGRKKPTFH